MREMEDHRLRQVAISVCDQSVQSFQRQQVCSDLPGQRHCPKAGEWALVGGGGELTRNQSLLQFILDPGDGQSLIFQYALELSIQQRSDPVFQRAKTDGVGHVGISDLIEICTAWRQE